MNLLFTLWWRSIIIKFNNTPNGDLTKHFLSFELTYDSILNIPNMNRIDCCRYKYHYVNFSVLVVNRYWYYREKYLKNIVVFLYSTTITNGNTLQHYVCWVLTFYYGMQLLPKMIHELNIIIIWSIRVFITILYHIKYYYSLIISYYYVICYIYILLLTVSNFDYHNRINTNVGCLRLLSFTWVAFTEYRYN